LRRFLASRVREGNQLGILILQEPFALRVQVLQFLESIALP